MIALKGIKKLSEKMFLNKRQRNTKYNFTPSLPLSSFVQLGSLYLSHPPAGHEMTPGSLTMHYGTLIKLEPLKTSLIDNRGPFKHVFCFNVGYHGSHKVIRWFWKVVKSFDNEQKLRLLQVCQRPFLICNVLYT